MSEPEEEQVESKSAQIDKTLRALGVPEVSTVTGLAKATQLVAVTLYNLLKRNVVTELSARGPRGERFVKRQAWAEFFATREGARIWERAAKKRQVNPRMSQAKFDAWYHGIDATGEVWLPFPVELGDGSLHAVYGVSNYARLKRTQAAQGATVGALVTPTLDPNGYPAYVFKRPPSAEEKAEAKSKGKKPKRYALSLKIHKVVAVAFLQQPDVDCEVLHIGPAHDAGVHNIRWGDHKENMAEVLPLAGESNPRAIHGAKEAREVVRLKASGWTQIRIAEHLEMDTTTVSQILSGKRWSSVTGLKRRRNP